MTQAVLAVVAAGGDPKQGCLETVVESDCRVGRVLRTAIAGAWRALRLARATAEGQATARIALGQVQGAQTAFITARAVLDLRLFFVCRFGERNPRRARFHVLEQTLHFRAREWCRTRSVD